MFKTKFPSKLKRRLFSFIPALFVVIFCNCLTSSYLHASVFITTAGIGIDKWASVWLLIQHGSNVRFVEDIGTVSLHDDFITFDTFGAEINRTGSDTTYSKLMDSIENTSEPAIKIGNIVYEIEIGAWNQLVSQESRVVEHAFRGMQMQNGRHNVTKACYLLFFDNLAAAIVSDNLSELKSTELIPGELCMEDESVETASSEQFNNVVPTLKLKSVLQFYSRRENVIFVDTRETWEFNEGRIPGSINIKLREVEDSLDRVRSAALVIAYCVKDFRGYETARAFRKYGINAAIMKPHGMRGWIEQGLPVAGTRGMPEDEAIAALQDLAEYSLQ